jgi:quinol monooxygenase YgiN
MATTLINPLVRFEIKEGKIEEFRAIASELAAATRQEPGCLRYEFNVSNDNPHIVWCVESWQNSEVLQTHLASEHVKKATALIPDVAEYQIIAAKPYI